jgi:hypothetical protein
MKWNYVLLSPVQLGDGFYSGLPLVLSENSRNIDEEMAFYYRVEMQPWLI